MHTVHAVWFCKMTYLCQVSYNWRGGRNVIIKNNINVGSTKNLEVHDDLMFFGMYRRYSLVQA